MNGALAGQVKSLLRFAVLESRRAAECAAEAHASVGFAGSVHRDALLELRDADASLRNACNAIAAAEHTLQHKGRPVADLNTLLTKYGQRGGRGESPERPCFAGRYGGTYK